MKKPPAIKAMKGEYIPSHIGGAKGRFDLGDVLGKLNGEQLFQISQSALGLAGEIVRHANERQKTRQMEVQASVRHKELDVQQIKNSEEHAGRMGDLDKDREARRLNHIEQMKVLNDEGKFEDHRQENVRIILGLIESGQINTDDVIRLIDAIDKRR